MTNLRGLELQKSHDMSLGIQISSSTTRTSPPRDAEARRNRASAALSESLHRSASMKKVLETSLSSSAMESTSFAISSPRIAPVSSSDARQLIAQASRSSSRLATAWAPLWMMGVSRFFVSSSPRRPVWCDRRSNAAPRRSALSSSSSEGPLPRTSEIAPSAPRPNKVGLESSCFAQQDRAQQQMWDREEPWCFPTWDSSRTSRTLRTT